MRLGHSIGALLLVWGAAAAAPTAPVDPLAMLGKSCPSTPIDRTRTDDRGYDCLEVELDLILDFDSRTILGRAHHRFRALGRLETVKFDLTDSLRVSAVWRGAEPVGFDHQDRILGIPLTPPLERGEQANVTIAYEGRPPREGLLGFSFEMRDGVPAAYTISEPSGASSWWPCHDVPHDKLLATIRLDVPDTLYAGSNGSLLSDEIQDGRRRMRWRESWPIAPYLIGIACTNYGVFGDLYRGIDGSVLPLLYLAYPEDLELARVTWANTPAMLTAFEERFGPYPFPGEKYGMAEFSWGGAMEHQTLSSFGEYAVDGTNQNDWLVAHELAHHWWGNKITVASWEHMWLNEGFSRFSEAIWFEASEGIGSYRDWIRQMWRPSFPGSIVPPDFLFNSTVYLKGAWVLHMLRGLLGDEEFFAALARYSEHHAYANATTEDLLKALEDVSGRDLDWFFEQWIYRSGRPAYDVTWSVDEQEGNLFLDLVIEQIQTEPTFRMPIVFEVEDPLGGYRFQIEDSLRVQTFRFEIRAHPYAINIDPDDWILRDRVGGSAVDDDPGIRLSLGNPWPSPGHPPFRIPLGERITGGWIDVWDLGGRRVATIPAPSRGPAIWMGRDGDGRDLPTGLYFVRPRASRTGDSPRRIWIVR